LSDTDRQRSSDSDPYRDGAQLAGFTHSEPLLGSPTMTGGRRSPRAISHRSLMHASRRTSGSTESLAGSSDTGSLGRASPTRRTSGLAHSPSRARPLWLTRQSRTGHVLRRYRALGRSGGCEGLKDLARPDARDSREADALESQAAYCCSWVRGLIGDESWPA
jgi:hypothetical protein